MMLMMTCMNSGGTSTCEVSVPHLRLLFCCRVFVYSYMLVIV